MKVRIFYTVICCLLINAPTAYTKNIQPFYKDRPFIQDFSQILPLSEELTGTTLSAVRSDRNGRILVLSNKGLLQVYHEQLVPDRSYRPLTDMQIKSMEIYRSQFVYLTDKAVLSNAWAGRLRRVAISIFYWRGKILSLISIRANALTNGKRLRTGPNKFCSIRHAAAFYYCSTIDSHLSAQARRSLQSSRAAI